MPSRLLMFCKKHIAPHCTWKSLINVTVNTLTVGQNIAGGLANTWSSAIGLAGFFVIQIDFSFENNKLRDEISELSREINEIQRKNLKTLKINFEPSGLQSLGIDNGNINKAWSYSLIAVNLLSASTATILTALVNHKGDDPQGGYCENGYCIAIYTSSACAFVLAVFEQHIKHNNLMRYINALKDQKLMENDEQKIPANNLIIIMPKEEEIIPANNAGTENNEEKKTLNLNSG